MRSFQLKNEERMKVKNFLKISFWAQGVWIGSVVKSVVLEFHPGAAIANATVKSNEPSQILHVLNPSYPYRKGKHK